MAKYFKFVAVAVPAAYMLSDRKTIDEQDVFGEFSPDEVRQLDLRGRPLSLAHKLKCDVRTQSDSGKLMIKDDPKRDGLIGRVVDQYLSDKGDLMVVCEIAHDARDAPELRQLKQDVAEMVRKREYGVSLTHALNHRPLPDGSATEVRKLPVEVSLTTEPNRKGSTVEGSWEGDVPYPVPEKKSDVYTGGATSLINWDAVTHNRKTMEEFSKKLEDMTRKQADLEKQVAAEKKRADDQEARVKQLAPLAESYKQAQQEKIDTQKKQFADTMKTIHEKSVDTYKKMLELPKDGIGADLSDTDRAALEHLATQETTFDPIPMLDKITSTLNPANNATAPPGDADMQDLYNRLGSFVQEMKTIVLANDRISGFCNKHVTQLVKNAASSAAATNRLNSQQPPPPHSSSATKKAEPFAFGETDWSAFAANVSKQRAAIMAPPTDL